MPASTPASAPAFLFDVGNVIVHFDFQLAVRKVQDQCRVAPDEILPALTPLTESFECGEMSTDEFVAEASDRIGYTGAAGNFINAFEDIFTLNEPVAALIAELDAAGRRLFILSNTNSIHAPYFTGRWVDLFDRFDGAVFSHEAGCMKPDPRIYEITVAQFDLDPAETIYIDDREENIRASEAFGFQAIQYDPEDHSVLTERLEREQITV